MPHTKNQTLTLTPIPRRWLRVNDAAEYIGVKPDTIRRFARQGLLPHYKLSSVSSSIIFEIRDLDRFVQKGKVY